MLALVDLDDDLLNLGLRGTIDPAVQSDLANSILAARRAVEEVPTLSTILLTSCA